MTKLATYEGIIENGHIVLPADVALPENARVYVLVPDAESDRTLQVLSPMLANPGQAKHFVKEVFEDSADASI